MCAGIRTVSLCLMAGAALTALTGCPPPQPPPTQPAQATSGPGSSSAAHASFTTQSFGDGAERYFLYQPASPTPSSAPVVIFLHGYSGVNARVYGGWIAHLLGRGYIVIYPQYQTTAAGADQYTTNAIVAITDAFSRLGADGNVAADTDKVAVVGHSLGGAIAMNYAALAASEGLPQPRAILLVNSADADVFVQSFPSILEGDFGAIAADTLFLAIVGQVDLIAGADFALKAFNGLTQIPVENRQVIQYRSDDYADPPVVADHLAPLSLDERFDSGISLIGSSGSQSEADTADVVDYNGYWKNFDGLLDAAFLGINREYALGGTDEQLSLGEWTDGTPIERALVLRP